MNRFWLQDAAIEPLGLAERIKHPASGGFVSFEGWIRNHHEGRSVLDLTYEAYPMLANKEGQRIVSQALEQFDIRTALCVHRTGRLAIGDLAVWVGVSSDHRREAFEACSWIIDAVKHSVPIWKKEAFADGSTAWVRCEGCAA